MNLIRNYRNWRAYRDTVTELDRLSNRQLHDLGIIRDEIRTIARKAVGRDPQTDNEEEYLSALEAEMLEAAEKLEFERAASLRDRILQIRSGRGGDVASPQAQSARSKAKGKGKARAGRKGGR